MDDNDAAMKAVLDDMGRHARSAKSKRYAPKPQPQAAAPVVEAAPEGNSMGEEDFRRLLESQH